jgi:hypothetical protein
MKMFEGIVLRFVKAAQQAVANSDRPGRKTSGIEKNRRLALGWFLSGRMSAVLEQAKLSGVQSQVVELVLYSTYQAPAESTKEAGKTSEGRRGEHHTAHEEIFNEGLS